MLEWVDWFNDRRLLEPIGDIPPAEFDAMYYEGQEGSAKEAGLNETSLRESRGGSVELNEAEHDVRFRS